MTRQTEIPVEEVSARKPLPVAKQWHCGTLVYTKAGLITLFFFLLWGNFCFTLMQQVVPSILPIKLKALGASNLVIGILLTSAFPVMGMFISPYLSFKSDYLRTRWGRRIPFFVVSLPFVVASILLLAFSQDIANYLHRTGLLSHLSTTGSIILVMGICIVFFQFADVLIASVYQYIFNDTVPVMLIGRFIGLMQIMGGSVGFLYNYFIFKYAESHMKEIFIWTAVFYGLGIGMLCLFVKEGEYAPVSGEELKNSRGIEGFKTFFRESFSHKFYWTKFLYALTPGACWVVGPFTIFFYREMGLTYDYVGKAVAITSVAAIASAYFSSIFIDRWHPLRILTYSGVFAVIFVMANWVWLFVTLPPVVFFWLNMMGMGIIGAFDGTLANLASMPFDIRLQPKSRYGQFCSAQSILANATKVVAGVLVGLFFDGLKHVFHGSDYAYRFNFVWMAVWLVISAVFICNVYLQWRELGGDLHFHPPAPWSPTGFEEMEQSPFVGTQVRWLKYALNMVHALMGLSVAYQLGIAACLWYLGWHSYLAWHFFALIPVSLVLYVLWIRTERSIRADVVRCKAGQKPLDGIPHHGVFFLKACTLLLLLTVWIGMTVSAIVCELHGGASIFCTGNLVTNALVIVAVLVLRRLERGYDPMLDYDGRKVAA